MGEEKCCGPQKQFNAEIAPNTPAADALQKNSEIPQVMLEKSLSMASSDTLPGLLNGKAPASSRPKFQTPPLSSKSFMEFATSHQARSPDIIKNPKAGCSPQKFRDASPLLMKSYLEAPAKGKGKASSSAKGKGKASSTVSSTALKHGTTKKSPAPGVSSKLAPKRSSEIELNQAPPISQFTPINKPPVGGSFDDPELISSHVSSIAGSEKSLWSDTLDSTFHIREGTNN